MNPPLMRILFFFLKCKTGAHYLSSITKQGNCFSCNSKCLCIAQSPISSKIVHKEVFQNRSVEKCHHFEKCANLKTCQVTLGRNKNQLYCVTSAWLSKVKCNFRELRHWTQRGIFKTWLLKFAFTINRSYSMLLSTCRITTKPLTVNTNSLL